MAEQRLSETVRTFYARNAANVTPAQRRVFADAVLLIGLLECDECHGELGEPIGTNRYGTHTVCRTCKNNQSKGAS